MVTVISAPPASTGAEAHATTLPLPAAAAVLSLLQLTLAHVQVVRSTVVPPMLTITAFSALKVTTHVETLAIIPRRITAVTPLLLLLEQDASQRDYLHVALQSIFSLPVPPPVPP